MLHHRSLDITLFRMNILGFMDHSLIVGANSGFTGRCFYFYIIDKNWDFIKIFQSYTHTHIYIYERNVYRMFEIKYIKIKLIRNKLLIPAIGLTYNTPLEN